MQKPRRAPPCRGQPDAPDAAVNALYHRRVARILVIGNSGSGKTTLAAAVSRRTGVPHIELDSIFHQSGWTPLPTDEFRARVSELTSGDEWVVCGNYTAVRDILWERADTVIAFDLPRRVVMWRVTRRTLSRLLRRKVLWNGNRETLRNILAFHDPERSIIRWAWSSHPSKHAEVEQVTNDPQWSDKTFVVVRDNRDAQRAVEGLPAVAASRPSPTNSTPDTQRRIT